MFGDVLSSHNNLSLGDEINFVNSNDVDHSSKEKNKRGLESRDIVKYKTESKVVVENWFKKKIKRFILYYETYENIQLYR